MAFIWWPVPLLVTLLTAELLYSLFAAGGHSQAVRLVIAAMDQPGLLPIATLLATIVFFFGRALWQLLHPPAADPGGIRRHGGRRLIGAVMLGKFALTGLALYLELIPNDLVESRNLGFLGVSVIAVLMALFAMMGYQTARLVVVLFFVLDILACVAAMVFIAVDPALALPWSHWLVFMAVVVDLILLACLLLASRRINALYKV